MLEYFEKIRFIKAVQGFDCYRCSVGGFFSGTIANSGRDFPAGRLCNVSIPLADG